MGNADLLKHLLPDLVGAEEGGHGEAFKVIIPIAPQTVVRETYGPHLLSTDGPDLDGDRQPGGRHLQGPAQRLRERRFTRLMNRKGLPATVHDEADFVVTLSLQHVVSAKDGGLCFGCSGTLLQTISAA